MNEPASGGASEWSGWTRSYSSDFLAYRNHAGLYADFHSCRHLFITSLERAGIRPKMAQTLARHSDIRLTMNVYTHVELHDQTAAIEALPGPPGGGRENDSVRSAENPGLSTNSRARIGAARETKSSPRGIQIPIRFVMATGRDMQHSSSINASNDGHRNLYADLIADGTLEASPLYGEKGTMFQWKYTNVARSLDPILDACPSAAWLTIGDGRHGSEANYIESKGGHALATDISCDLLRSASENGYISRYAMANAEALPFEEGSFDFVCCKEAAHHFPRPFLAVYEMLRVARHAVVLVEPADPLVCDRWTQVPLTFLRSCVNRLVFGRNRRNDFEPVGNYLYRLSIRELEKLAIGMGLAGLAVHGVNDFHGVRIRNDDGTMRPQKSGAFAILWTLVRLQDLLSRLHVLQPVVYSFVLFKAEPGELLASALKRHGYKFLHMPENPHP